MYHRTHTDRYFRRLSTQYCKKNIVATMCTSFKGTPDNSSTPLRPPPIDPPPSSVITTASDAEADTCTFADRTWCDQIESSTVQLSFIVPSRVLDRIGTIGIPFYLARYRETTFDCFGVSTRRLNRTNFPANTISGVFEHRRATLNAETEL